MPNEDVMSNRAFNMEALLNPQPADENRNAARELLHSAAYAGLQAPIEGVSQLVNHVSGSKVIPDFHIVDAPKAAEFGSVAWHAQQFGGAVGMIGSFYAVNKGVGAVMAKPASAAEAASLRFKVTQAASSGFVYDGLMRPVHADEGNFWLARAKHATVGAVTFGTLAASAHGLNAFGKAAPDSMAFKGTIRNELFNHTVAGVVAGSTNVQLESLLSGRGFASKEDTMRGGYTFAMVGLGLRGVEKGREVLAERVAERAAVRTSLNNLREDLREVPVRSENGKVTDVFEKINEQPESVLRADQKQRLANVLAEARDGFYKIDEALPAGHKDKGYQIVNWKHTRGEIDQVLEAAKLSETKMTPEQVEDAILASIYSDSVKSPANFIRHHLDGAKAAEEALPRHLDPAKPGNAERIANIVQAIREHQIAPPGFMRIMVEMNIRNAVKAKNGSVSEADNQIIGEIGAKIAKPFESVDPANPRVVNFTPEQRQYLEMIGLKDWYVPFKGDASYPIARRLIDGDGLINYASPDGWAKIAQIRGPGTIFKDATIWDSLASAKSSYNDALSVMSQEVHPLAQQGLARTEAAVARVTPEMQNWVNANKEKFGYGPNEKVAFWDKDAEPLRYSKEGEPLEARDALRLEFAREIRDQMVRQLREQQGNYSLEP
jgi:hypothetical protein